MVRPFTIIGGTEHASMNTFYGFGMYSAIQAYTGEPLVLWCDFKSWEFEVTHSTIGLTEYLI